MCGIAGIYSKDSGSDSGLIVEQMMNSLRHRGPDDEGIYRKEHICLGHRRLSILDLSDAGRQPMSTMEKRHWIVFNGEIYNYIELRAELTELGCSFQTGTDTEVILQAYIIWGRNCLQRFNGMWSFAIWDEDKQELFCARDRFGVKPFVYHYDSEQFVFASEIKALLRHPRIKPEANLQSVYDFIIYARANHTNDSFFKGIHQLPGAHYCVVNKHGMRLERYWDISERNVFEGTLEQSADEFYRIFEDAVRLRFRSDVEVGSCLSGGLDSSSIVCVADKLIAQGEIETENKLHTFSLISPFGQYDESQWIDIVRAQTNIKSDFTSPTEQDLLDKLKELIYTQEEPFGSTSIFGQYVVMQLIHQHGIKVTLDGQGADEMLAGYLGYADSYFADLYLSGNHFELYKQVDIYCAKHKLTSSIAIDRAKKLVETGRLGRHIEANAKYLAPKFAQTYYKEISPERKFPSFLQNQMYHDLVSFSIPAYLRHEDRNSMAFSIESRLPFLDYRLVEFVFSLPPEMKLHDSVTKVILRKAMQGVIPEKIENRQDKMGFVTPEAIWFRGGLRPMLDSLFYSEEIESRNIFDIETIRKEWENFKVGTRNDSFLIWRIASVELWYRTFIDYHD